MRRPTLRAKLLLVVAIFLIPLILAAGILTVTGRWGTLSSSWMATTALWELYRSPSNLSAAFRAGQGFYGLKDYTKAVSYFETATELNASSDLAWNGLGNAYRESSRPQDAETAFSRAISIQPTVAIYYLNLADLYQHWPSGSRNHEAQLTLENGAKVTHNDSSIIKALVEYFTSVGDTKSAQPYQKLLEENK